MTPTLRMQRRARRRLLVAGLLALLLVPAGPSATVRGAGDPPTAASDAYTTNEDTTLVVDAPGVLANDTDPETDALTAVVASDVSHGTLSLAADGSFTYTPAPQFNGSDTFTYHANDGTSNSSDATVTVTVGAVNDAPSFTKGADQVVAEDAGSRSVPGWASALSAGPPDEASQALSFSVTNDANGLFAGQPAIDPTGSLAYEPAPNANGSATVTAVLHDDGGTASGGVDASPGQTFTITVTAVNDAPVLDPAAFDPPLTSVAEDATDPGGDHVSTMLGGAPPGYIQDVDAGALQGIALTPFFWYPGLPDPRILGLAEKLRPFWGKTNLH